MLQMLQLVSCRKLRDLALTWKVLFVFRKFLPERMNSESDDEGKYTKSYLMLFVLLCYGLDFEIFVKLSFGHDLWLDIKFYETC